MKLFAVLSLMLSFSAFANVTCVVSKGSLGTRTILKRVVLTREGMVSRGFAPGATPLYEERGHKYFAAYKMEPGKGTDIMIAKTIPAALSGLVYVAKAMGYGEVDFSDNTNWVKCTDR